VVDTGELRASMRADTISPGIRSTGVLSAFPKPSSARSAQMCPGFAMLPPLHPGWDSVLRTRSAVARCSIPRVAASGAALPRRYEWRPTRCIMQKIISASSFGASLGNSASPRQSPPPLTNSHALCITCLARGKLTTRVSFTAATKKL
jgi:hypothetical protein